jgi:hypothetical protein
MCNLEAINWLALVLLRAQQFLDFVNSQEASQPVPLIIVPDEKPIIAVGSFISAPTKHNIT